MIYLLDEKKITFPHPSLANEDGLLAIGGDLSLDRLIVAYQHGIFPWYDEDSPILWYAPLERFVLYPKKLKISKSLKQVWRSQKFRVTTDQAFEQVVEHCASIYRPDQEGTWIVEDMQKAYRRLFQAGFAHSIEVWESDRLVGGLYGVQVGQVFCGESMFSKVSNASKIALLYLCQSFNFQLIDCQIPSDHLTRMGAELIPQDTYLQLLAKQKMQAHDLQRTF